MNRILVRRSVTSVPCQQCLRSISSETLVANPTPMLLQKMRADLKTAMRSKDTNRLSVLRTLLADVTNASKTATPAKTDIQLLPLLRKRVAQSRAAATEFANADRNDLKEKEIAQIAVLEEYAGVVKTISEDEIRSEVSKAMEVVKAAGQNVNLGSVVKTLMSPGGSLYSKPVDRAEVARVVKEGIQGVSWSAQPHMS